MENAHRRLGSALPDRHRALQRLLRHRRTHRRPRPDRDPPLRRAFEAGAHCFPRTELHRAAWSESRLRHVEATHRLRVHGHTCDGLRLPHRGKAPGDAEGAADPQRLRCQPVSNRAPHDPGPRWCAGARFDPHQEGFQKGRQPAAAPLRLRSLRHGHAA